MASELEKAVSRYRAEVDRGERETLLDLARLWGKSRGAMQNWINALINRINDDGGEWEGYLNSLYRYEMMREQARKIIDGYMADVFRVVGKKIRTNVTLGLGNAKKLIEIMTGNDPAMNLKTGTAMDAEEIIAALTREGSPFDRLMRKDYSDEVTEAIRDTLTRGVAMGSGWEQVAKEMTEVSDMTFDRAKRIARTEMNRALRQSTLEGYRASGVVKAYRRMCYKETACFACLMMDGELYDLEMDFSDHPNGKCTIIPVMNPNEKPDWETGREWFMEQSDENQQRIMGKGRFELWKTRKLIDLTEFVELEQNQTWGSSPHLIPIKDLSFTDSPAPINIEKGGFQYIGDLRDLSKLYSYKDPGSVYAVQKPVIYNDYAANHIKKDHPERIKWLEENQDAIIRAVSDPEFIEKETRYKNLIDRYSVTLIVKAVTPKAPQNQYMAVAVTLSNNLEKGGYHQVTTIHPVRKSHVLKADGTPKDGMIKIK